MEASRIDFSFERLPSSQCDPRVSEPRPVRGSEAVPLSACPQFPTGRASLTSPVDFKLHHYLILVTVYVVAKISSDQRLYRLEVLLSTFDGPPWNVWILLILQGTSSQ
jgi:hypothetical protein